MTKISRNFIYNFKKIIKNKPKCTNNNEVYYLNKYTVNLKTSVITTRFKFKQINYTGNNKNLSDAFRED